MAPAFGDAVDGVIAVCRYAKLFNGSATQAKYQSVAWHLPQDRRGFLLLKAAGNSLMICEAALKPRARLNRAKVIGKDFEVGAHGGTSHGTEPSLA
jgi:hypothetical protein